MNPEEYIKSGELELLALGIADEQQASNAMAMIAEFPEVAAEYERIAADLELAFEPVAVAAPDKIKQGLFAKISEQTGTDTSVVEDVKPIAPVTPLINSEKELETKSTVATASITSQEAKLVPLYYKYAAAASVVIAALSIIANLLLFQKYNEASSELVALRSENTIMAGEVERTSNEMGTLRKKLEITTELDSKKIMLAGLNTASKAKAAIIYSKNTPNVEIRLENIPSVPSDKDLQLWAIVDGKPVDLGVVTLDKSGDSLSITHALANIPTKIDAFAFTLEDKGGHPQPQGEMWLIGNF